MQFKYAALTFLITLTLASPLPKKFKASSTSTASASSNSTVAATSAPAAGSLASVLSSQTYAELSISAGTAGTAQAEAAAKFPVDTTNLAGVSASDLKLIKAAHDAAEDAETDAFDPQIVAASGDAATALQNGKIKNKVLKLTAEVLGLQIQQAQGDTSVASDITAETTKLNNNIALDKAAAGQASTAVAFTADD